MQLSMTGPPKDLDAIRIRNNQRRSRARRKEYTHELESRLREYEIKGVKVAQEIQDAARAVLEENRQLRLLLDELRGERGGVIENSELGPGLANVEELNAQLKRAGIWTDTKVGGNHERKPKKRKLDIATSGARADYHMSEVATGGSEISSPLPTRSNVNHEPLHLRSSPQYPGQNSPRFSQHHQSDYHTDKLVNRIHHLSTPPKDPVPCLIPDVSPSSQLSPAVSSELSSSDDSSSCAFAVAVLTSMRSDVAVEDISAELGCATDPERCKVDNKRLFTTVDRYTG